MGVFPLREWFADLCEQAVSVTSGSLLVRRINCARVNGASERLWSREVCVWIDFWLRGGLLLVVDIVCAVPSDLFRLLLFG